MSTLSINFAYRFIFLSLFNVVGIVVAVAIVDALMEEASAAAE